MGAYMGDWYMENGTYTSHKEDMAYDQDNSAWVEMGSTPGSTPVWWREHRSNDSSSHSSTRTAQPSKEVIERRERMQRLQEELESLEEQAKELRAKSATWADAWILPLIGISICGFLYVFGASSFDTMESSSIYHLRAAHCRNPFGSRAFCP